MSSILQVPTADYGMMPVTFPRLKRMTDEEFFEFCQRNENWRIEMTRKGVIIIMPNTGGTTGDRNSEINYQLRAWMRQTKIGRVFESSTTFRLPNTAQRSPDASFVTAERWNALTKEERDKFPPLCPDFVLELRSRTDSLKKLQAKMAEYMENGARLGWLIDPRGRKVYVYRPNTETEILDNPATVSGESVLPGFVLDLTDIFE